MKPEQIVGIIVRCFAVYLFSVMAYPALAMLSDHFFVEHTSLDFPLYVALRASFGVIVPVILWFFPLTLARLTIPAAKNAETKEPASFSQIENLSYSLLGLWVTLSGARDCLYRFDLMPEHSGKLVAPLFYLGMGLLIMLRPQGIAAGLKKLRGGID